jgi:hypothetical protein
MVGIENLKSLVKNVFEIAKIVIRTVKVVPALKEELADIDVSEASALLVQVVIEEVPAIITELKK